jgi:hypothetical protein
MNTMLDAKRDNSIDISAEMEWTTNELGFNSQQELIFFLFSKAARPSLGSRDAPGAQSWLYSIRSDISTRYLSNTEQEV